MSIVWATVIGAVIGAAGAIAGGFWSAWWQTSRADDVAQKIRRAERREAALLALSGKLAELKNEVLHLRAQAREHPEASPGERALKLLLVFDDFWSQGQVSGVIPDTSIIEAKARLYGFPVWRSNFGPRPARSAVGDDEPLRPADVIDLDKLWLAVNHMNDTVNLEVSGLLRPAPKAKTGGTPTLIRLWGMLLHKPSTEAEEKYQADKALAARRAELLDAAREAESQLRQAQARRAPEAEIRRLAEDLDAALTAAMRAAYAAQRAEIGPRGYDDRIYRRKARATPRVHTLNTEAERLLTLRETHRLNGIPAVTFVPSPPPSPPPVSEA